MKEDLRIKSVEAGEVFMVNNGTRENITFKDAVFKNSLLALYLKENGLKEKANFTKDIINVKFNFGAEIEGIKELEDELAKLNKDIKTKLDSIKEYKVTKNNEIKEIRNTTNDQALIRSIREDRNKYEESVRAEIKELRETKKAITEEMENIKANVNLDEYTKEGIRKDFYKNGFKITYKENGKDRTIEYVYLFRSVGKAKKGDAIFIRKGLSKKAQNWLNMNIKFPKNFNKIVELEAYKSLSSSSIIGTINIKPEEILIVKDRTEILKYDCRVVYNDVDAEGNDIAKVTGNVEREIESTLWDGMALVEDSIIPKEYNSILLRQRMFKAFASRTYIQKFMKDYYGNEYETATVKDMFGRDVRVKDIKLISTNNAIKWLKFKEYMGATDEEVMEYWLDCVREDNNRFGICSTEHGSKLGEVQRMSYQMVNSLDATKEEIEELCKTSIDYINSLKDSDDKFIEYLEIHKSFNNSFEMIIDMYNNVKDFDKCKFFRKFKTEEISRYKREVMGSKLLTEADNMVLVGNPYALLLHVVGEEFEQDPTMYSVKNEYIGCYCKRFKDIEYLVGFRSPHNSPNNIAHFRNFYSEDNLITKYFNLSDNIIALDGFSDIYPRANGADLDYDKMYVSSDETLCNIGKRCYKNYKTILNEIEPDGAKDYKNTLECRAIADNILQSSSRAIGEFSNIAQKALSKFYSTPNTDEYKADRERLEEIFIICSVLAQVSIDGAKRAFKVDLNTECKNLKKEELLKDSLPVFWKYTHSSKDDKGNRIDWDSKINKNMNCPSNVVVECIDKNVKYADKTKNLIDLSDMIVEVNGKAKKEQIDIIVDTIYKYNRERLDIIKDSMDLDDEELVAEMSLLNQDIFEEISKRKLSDKTYNRLICRCCGNDKKLNKISMDVLNILYRTSPKRFLNQFISKN